MIRVHIDRLIVDVPVADPRALQRSVEGELTRLLALASFPHGSARALQGVRGADITDASHEPQALGVQIARAVHTGLVRSGGAGLSARPSGETGAHP